MYPQCKTCKRVEWGTFCQENPSLSSVASPSKTNEGVFNLKFSALVATFSSVVLFLACFTQCIALPSPRSNAKIVSPTESNAAARTVRLYSHRNLRSLDGLPARGGVVRAGAIYRSARLTHLSATDVSTINDLHLHTLIDVRNWLETVYEGGDSGAVTHAVAERLWLPMHGTIHYVSMLRAANGHDSIHRFFATLADRQAYPVLYHCAFGRDRTGTLTALLLELLGTPRSVIMDDYLASGPQAKPDRLQAVFDEIDRRGGILALLHGYQLTDADFAAIRDNLVMPASASSADRKT